MREGKIVKEIEMTGDKLITVRPKLVAGSEEEEIKIVSHNSNGFPSTKDNLHKL